MYGCVCLAGCVIVWLVVLVCPVVSVCLSDYIMCLCGHVNFWISSLITSLVPVFSINAVVQCYCSLKFQLCGESRSPSQLIIPVCYIFTVSEPYFSLYTISFVLKPQEWSFS